MPRSSLQLIGSMIDCHVDRLTCPSIVYPPEEANRGDQGEISRRERRCLLRVRASGRISSSRYARGAQLERRREASSHLVCPAIACAV